MNFVFVFVLQIILYFHPAESLFVYFLLRLVLIFTIKIVLTNDNDRQYLLKQLQRIKKSKQHIKLLVMIATMLKVEKVKETIF